MLSWQRQWVVTHQQLVVTGKVQAALCDLEYLEYLIQLIKSFLWVAANFTGKYPPNTSLCEVQLSWPWTECGLGTSRCHPLTETAVASAQLLLSTHSSTPPPPSQHMWTSDSRVSNSLSKLFSLNKSLLTIPVSIKPPFHVLGNTKGTRTVSPSGLFSNQKAYDSHYFPLLFLHLCLWSGWSLATGTLAGFFSFPDSIVLLI